MIKLTFLNWEAFLKLQQPFPLLKLHNTYSNPKNHSEDTKLYQRDEVFWHFLVKYCFPLTRWTQSQQNMTDCAKWTMTVTSENMAGDFETKIRTHKWLRGVSWALLTTPLKYTVGKQAKIYESVILQVWLWDSKHQSSGTGVTCKSSTKADWRAPPPTWSRIQSSPCSTNSRGRDEEMATMHDWFNIFY